MHTPIDIVDAVAVGVGSSAGERTVRKRAQQNVATANVNLKAQRVK